MTINVVKPFKSQTAKTFNKSKIGRDVHVGERFHSADVSPYLGRRIFSFSTAATVVDDNLTKPKPLEHVKEVRSSSLFNVCADIHVKEQKKFLSKVKSMKNNITKLFKPTGRVSGVAPFIDPFVEHGATDDHSSSLTFPSILRHGKPKAHIVTVCESTSPRHTSLESISSHIAYDKNIVSEHIEDLAISCGLAEASFPSSAGRLLATPESQLGMPPSTFSLGKLQTIEEEDGGTEVVIRMNNTEQKESVTSDSYISRSNCDSAITAYLSSNTLSDHTTTYGAGLVCSETNVSSVDTSLATSVDAEDNHQFFPGALRALRRIPSYEDLRTTANRDSSCSDMASESSDYDFSYGGAFIMNAAPLRRSRKRSNLRKSFLSLEPKMYTPSTGRMNQYREFRAWLSTRCHEFPRDTQKTSASRGPSETLKATPICRSRQYVQNVICPSSRVQAHVFKPSPSQPPLPLSLPIWSCAKITRSGSKAKKRQRDTKQLMKELKFRLGSMDIDPWY